MRIKSVFTAENNELVTMKSAREEEKKENGSENGRDKGERKQERERKIGEEEERTDWLILRCTSFVPAAVRPPAPYVSQLANSFAQ